MSRFVFSSFRLFSGPSSLVRSSSRLPRALGALALVGIVGLSQGACSTTRLVSRAGGEELVVSDRQFHLIFGLINLSSPGAQECEAIAWMESEETFVDGLINFFVPLLSSRTVTYACAQTKRGRLIGEVADEVDEGDEVEARYEALAHP